MRLVTIPGVFPPHNDSWQLAAAAAAAVRRGSDVLDLCSGSGVVALSAARAGASRVVAVDVYRRAQWTISLNAALNGLTVTARRGDLFAPVAGQRFDMITSNPPYVPDAGHERLSGPLGTAVEGGFDGRVVLDRIIAQAPGHLRAGGCLLVVHSAVCGIQATVAALRAAGMEAQIVSRKTGSLGLLAPRAEHLQATGLLPAGATDEEVVVLQGRVPGEPGPVVGEHDRGAAQAPT